MRGAIAGLPPLKGARILAVRVGALGDTIVTLPALRALRREAGPEGDLDLVGTEPYIGLARGDGSASRVHPFERGPFRTDLRDFVSSFDVVVAWTRHDPLRAVLAASDIASLEAPPLPPPGIHASDHLLGTLSPWGITGRAPAPAIVFSDDARREASQWMTSQALVPGPRFVALHPGSGSPAKNWPEARFQDLARLARAAGYGVVWVAGEADVDRVTRLESSVPAPVARQLELSVLGAVLSRASGYVGNDSGVSHLAAATGVPSIVLFGPTDPRQWAPRGSMVGVVDCRSSAAMVWGIAREAFSPC
jgi:heptosyltransferase-3